MKITFCWLRGHNWTYPDAEAFSSIDTRECARCGRSEMRIFANMGMTKVWVRKLEVRNQSQRPVQSRPMTDAERDEIAGIEQRAKERSESASKQQFGLAGQARAFPRRSISSASLIGKLDDPRIAGAVNDKGGGRGA